MHLGSRSNFSTFRLTLGSVLGEKAGSVGINEDQLSVWMYEHLAVIPVDVEDGDVVDGLETEVQTEVLRRLDRPLNLAEMPKSVVRARLTELRREHGTKPDNRPKSSAWTSGRGKAKQRPVKAMFSPDEEERITRAAEAVGVTVDEFVHRAAVEKADDLAGTAEVIARARGVSVNQVILEALRAEVDRVREDEEFMSLLQTLVERDKEILDRLAE